MDRSILASTSAPPFAWLRRALWQITAGHGFRAQYYARLAALVADQPREPATPAHHTEPLPLAH